MEWTARTGTFLSICRKVPDAAGDELLRLARLWLAALEAIATLLQAEGLAAVA